ncbi:LCP family protein [Nonomuraea sediminis]|uniref:LCP family protein n=1 Tax=Nonomuraea sediminis TaxID=2835864 RepID=UPI001BDD34CC|nr:LCP family protein [Nonomuraea sediminis]
MSDYRGTSIDDRRAAPTQPGSRMSRRAGATPPPPPPPPEDLPPRGHRSGGGAGGGKMRLLAWISIAMTSIMVAGSLTAYVVYRDAVGNIIKKDFKQDIVGPRPAETGALNVLLVGSDTRAGKGNARYGQKLAREADGGGKRTDTIILLHISPNRDKARLISFPRDSMVQIPACKNESTKQVMPARRDMINSAYNSGGIACTIATLESLTGIRIDHFAEVDFSGFKSIVDALGGIEICLKSGVNDRNSHLVLPAGKSLLDGEKALGFVRLRHYGDGSDIQRIKRQQLFLSKVVAKAMSSDLLTDVPRLRNFIAAAGKSVTMDPDLANDTEQLIEIAQSVKKMTTGGINFTTVPWGPDPEDKNRVVWTQDANVLFNAIKSDVDVTLPTAKPSTGTTTAPKADIKPEQVRVQVLNGTTTFGKAKEVADQLSKEGFQVVGVGNYQAPDGKSQPTTELRYAKKDATGADYAAVLSAAMDPKPGPTAGKAKAVNPQPYVPTTTPTTTPVKGAPTIQLIVGSDFKGVKVTKLPDSVNNQTISANQAKSSCA